MKLTVRKMAHIALGAALLAVFSQISIPVGPVPINLALLAVFAMGAVLPEWEAVKMCIRDRLGIIIGVIALVVLVSLVNSATTSVTDQISSLGNNLLSATILDTRSNPLRLSEL